MGMWKKRKTNNEENNNRYGISMFSQRISIRLRRVAWHMPWVNARELRADVASGLAGGYHP